MFGGGVGVATGVLTVIYPGSIALTLVYVIGAWAIIIGILKIAAAIRLRNVITPLVYAFGFHAILAGIAQISLGVRLRGMGQALQPQTQQAASPSR